MSIFDQLEAAVNGDELLAAIDQYIVDYGAD